MKNTAKANRIAGCPLLVHKSPLVIFIAFSKHKDSLIFKFFKIIGGSAVMPAHCGFEAIGRVGI